MGKHQTPDAAGQINPQEPGRTDDGEEGGSHHDRGHHEGHQNQGAEQPSAREAIARDHHSRGDRHHQCRHGGQRGLQHREGQDRPRARVTVHREQLARSVSQTHADHCGDGHHEQDEEEQHRDDQDGRPGY